VDRTDIGYDMICRRLNRHARSIIAIDPVGFQTGCLNRGFSDVLRTILLGLFLAAFSISQTLNVSEARQRADRGDASAEGSLGVMYYNGGGIPALISTSTGGEKS
jgi:hypothetical protein